MKLQELLCYLSQKCKHLEMELGLQLATITYYLLIELFHFVLQPPVPCPPEDVVHVLDCSTNTAVVEWQASRGADYYIVQAVGVEEDETSCETMSQSCILADLLCGFTYNISVIAVNDVCNVSKSDTQQMQAGTIGNVHV